MYVRVLRPFIVDGIYHGPGDELRVFTDEMEAELPQLIAAGIVVVLKKVDDDPVQLETPEDGQSFVHR